MNQMNDLLEIMRRLRDPESGCPWDVKQNFTTIAPYTIEEAYEVADAIARDDMSDLREELGDLLLQVIFHAQMAAEKSLFDYADVVDTLSKKLIRRHPHVFADENVQSDAELHALWENEKQKEREEKLDIEDQSIMQSVTLGLPALMRAYKIQKKAASVGFDWPNTESVIAKIKEEVQEVEEAIQGSGKEHQEEEIGDLLFAVVNLARHLKIDSETALKKANEKFIRRFAHIEQALQTQERTFADATLEEMEDYWQAAKALKSKEEK